VSICGVGVDIESIERFNPSKNSDRLVARIFTSGEVDYCSAQAMPARHYAARFAAKEATIKALNTVLPELLITQVEVYNVHPSPAPHARLINGAILPDNIRLHLSLSHAAEYAIAFVTAEDISND
jgi:holo-[acyl-carrier protein] synthase